jgi:uncharacterized protein (UPF0264 family)
MIEYVKGFYTDADETGRSLFDFMQDGGLLQEFIDLYTDLKLEKYSHSGRIKQERF